MISTTSVKQGFAVALSTYRPRASRYRNVWDFRFPSYFECCVVEAPASRKVHAALRFRNSCKFSPCNHNAGTADQRHDPKQTFSTHTGDNNVIKGLGYSRNRRVSGQRLCLLFSQNRIPGASPRKNPLHFTTDIL